MQAEQNDAALIVASAVIGAGAALAGALVGGVVTLWIDFRGRNEKRRDELRSVYIEWFTAIDALTQCDASHIALDGSIRQALHGGHLNESQMQGAMEVLSRHQLRLESVRDETVHRESSAFSRLLIADGGSAEFRQVDHIRKLAPFKSCNGVESETGNHVPDPEVFFRLEKQQAEDLGRLAMELRRRFSG